MVSSTAHRSVVVLDRPAVAPESVIRRPVTVTPAREIPPRPADRKPSAPAGLGPALRSPGLALLTAAAILEGYKWLDVIPVGDSRVSSLLFGRVGAVAFAAVASAFALVLTRPVAGPRRSPVQWLLVGTIVGQVAATSVAVLSDSMVAATVVGVTDLVVASAAGGVLIAGELSARRGVGENRRSAPVETADQAVPVP
jgi:hypothetical protein